MINPFEMVILIVLIVTIGKVILSRRSRREDRIAPEERVEAMRLQDEVKQLKERIHVLERIATDKEDTLSREIDNLRDR